MPSGTYVKTIKFDADTTKVLNEINRLNIVVQDTSKKFGKGFFSPELKKSLSDFKDGLLDALDIGRSPEMQDLKDKLQRLVDEKEQLTSMQTNLQGQMQGKEGTEEWDRLKKALDDVTKKLEEVNDKIFDTQDDMAIQKEQEAKEFSGKMGKAAGKKVVEVFQKIGQTIANFMIKMFKEALEKAEEIASYDLQNTVKFNQKAIDLATQYGLTGGEAYATQRAAEQMGYGDVDTLMENLWNMNDNQIAEFNKLQKQYAESYENDKKIAHEYQQFTQEWNDFKEEFTNELLAWFSANKNEIKQVLNMLMDFMKWVLDLLSAIAEAFGDATERSDTQRSAATNDIINSYRNSNTNNVNVSNTFNVSGDRLQSNAELQQAGSTTYRQLLDMFK